MDPIKSDLTSMGGAIAHALQAEGQGSGEIRIARGRFLDTVATRGVRKSRGGWRWAFAGLAAASCGLALYAWSLRPITFRVGEQNLVGKLGDVVETTGSAATKIRFSDGSGIALAETGRLRVLSAHARGARVLIESGAVDVDVAHGKRPRGWAFEAGPFEVKVTGTRFALSFEPRTQSLRLAMREGQVVVNGPCLEKSRVLGAGEVFEASCQSAEPEGIEFSETLPSVQDGGEGVETTRDVPRDRWRSLLAGGRLTDALVAAERMGLEKVSKQATARELLRLADAARLSHRATRAVFLLSALRQRFPRSYEAPIAAFTLGRIAFEDRHAFSDAAGHFAAYLAEAPQGPLMGDALGRLMESRQRAGNLSAARAEAEKYLRRFPTGPYADQARGILSR